MNLKGDCIEVMKAMKPNSMDAIVTDPPYGLEFMGKEWDKLWNNSQSFNINRPKSGAWQFGNTPSSQKRVQYKAGLEMQLWHTQWLTEAYRVLKPGGSMLVMGGTRTSHRLACAIEDSGFIIKDTLMWLYGSGFPKAQDLGKMIDKRAKAGREVIGHKGGRYNSPGTDIRKGSYVGGKPGEMMNLGDITLPSTDLAKHWDGFKVGGIKPAYEPIIWAVKPPEGSYVDNVLKWGVGAVNVDECRVGLSNYDKEDYIPNRCGHKDGINHIDKLAEKHNSAVESFGARGFEKPHWNQKGRFPANVILSHHPECVQVGMKKVKGIKGGCTEFGGMFGNKGKVTSLQKDHADKDGYEQVESWGCHPDCAVRLLDEQSGVLKSGQLLPRHKRSAGNLNCYGKATDTSCTYPQGGDSGGASRFFYCAKASRGERNAGLEGMPEKECFNLGHKDNPGRNAPKKSYPRQNNHPTVKPIKLFEWLIKLVTREGQIVLDPFIGSGTTSIAAHNTGRKCVGIEKEGEYLEIAKRRISYWQNQPKQNSLNLGG